MSQPALENPAIRERATRIDSAAYRQMVASGLLSERTELIEGTVVDKMTKSPDHNYYADALYEALREVLPAGAIIRAEKTLSYGDSDLEPDIMVVEGPLERYRQQNPSTAILVVEIAKSSLSFDRAKGRVYAGAGVPLYWIVDIDNKLVYIYEMPTADGYSRQSTALFSSAITVFGQNLDLTRL